MSMNKSAKVIYQVRNGVTYRIHPSNGRLPEMATESVDGIIQFTYLANKAIIRQGGRPARFFAIRYF